MAQPSADSLHHNTMIIPTFNRPQHLKKLVKYYAEKKTGMHFLILDSSHPEIAQTNRDTCLTLGHRARHVVFAGSIPVMQKLVEGLQLVETPYCNFGADDDLTFIDGLIQALHYLEEHLEYVCVDGIYLNFKQEGNDIRVGIEYSGRGIEEDHPLARIFRLFQKYESLFYGVCRTAQMRDVFDSANLLATLSYQEIFQSSAALLLGKKQRLPIFYAARQGCGRADTRDKWNSHVWFMEDPEEYIKNYLPYREELWKFYERHSQENLKLSKDAFYRALGLAHTAFLISGTSSKALCAALGDISHEINEQEEDLCQQLKKTPHRKLDAGISKCLDFLQRHHQKISALFFWRNINAKWHCIMQREFRYLPANSRFQQAYRDLCLYLNE